MIQIYYSFSFTGHAFNAVFNKSLPNHKLQFFLKELFV